MCFMASYNMLGVELVFCGGEKFVHDMCLVTSYNMLSDELISS